MVDTQLFRKTTKHGFIRTIADQPERECVPPWHSGESSKENIHSFLMTESSDVTENELGRLAGLERPATELATSPRQHGVWNRLESTRKRESSPLALGHSHQHIGTLQQQSLDTVIHPDFPILERVSMIKRYPWQRSSRTPRKIHAQSWTEIMRLNDMRLLPFNQRLDKLA